MPLDLYRLTKAGARGLCKGSTGRNDGKPIYSVYGVNSDYIMCTQTWDYTENATLDREGKVCYIVLREIDDAAY